jgi:hypothetical protein
MFRTLKYRQCLVENDDKWLEKYWTVEDFVLKFGK